VLVWNAGDKFSTSFIYVSLGFTQRSDAVFKLHDIALQNLFRNRYPRVKTRVRQEETASTGDMTRG
jgi:hypothetical protein